MIETCMALGISNDGKAVVMVMTFGDKDVTATHRMTPRQARDLALDLFHLAERIDPKKEDGHG